MNSAIVVAVDPRRDDPAPLALGLRLARLAGGRLLLAAGYPVQGADRVHPELAETARSETEDALRRAAAQVRDAPGSSPPIDVRAIAVTGMPAAALHELAAEVQPLLIVIGSSSRGELGRVSPGAVTDRLLHGATCPVAVAPRGLSLDAADAPFLRVGSAYVDAPDAQAALRAAIAIAHSARAHLRLFVVRRPAEPHSMAAPQAAGFDHETPRRHEADEQLRHGLESAGRGADGQVLDGDPAGALAAAASNYDLLVCGSRGHGPVKTLVLGSTSHALVRRAQCPVLVVPRGTEDALAAGFPATPARAALS